MVVLGGLVIMFLQMIGVAFFIVTERKGLGMLQLRQGPNKVSFKGILQAVADGVKLFKKEYVCPHKSCEEMFVLGPYLMFISAYCLWISFPVYYPSIIMGMGFLFFLCVSSFSVYGIIAVGMACDSRYAFLGAMRAVAQSISYEVYMSLVLFCTLLVLGSYNIGDFRLGASGSDSVGFFHSWGYGSHGSACLVLDALLLWLIAVLAETNRTPFDFVEGESELVAGYMVEYGGGGFALIALAEYSNIMFISMLTGVMFFGGIMQSSFFGTVVLMGFTCLISYWFVLMRAALPRYRYDLLMELCWVVMLPYSLGLFMFSMMMGA